MIEDIYMYIHGLMNEYIIEMIKYAWYSWCVHFYNRACILYLYEISWVLHGIIICSPIIILAQRLCSTDKKRKRYPMQRLIWMRWPYSPISDAQAMSSKLIYIPISMHTCMWINGFESWGDPCIWKVVWAKAIYGDLCDNGKWNVV